MKNIIFKKNLVISNSLINSKYSLTKEEQSIIYLVISQIDKEDENFKDYKISILDLEKITGKKHNRVRLKKITRFYIKKTYFYR